MDCLWSSISESLSDICWANEIELREAHSFHKTNREQGGYNSCTVTNYRL